MDPLFERKLDQYSEVIVRAGLNLQPGQKLVVIAPVQTAPLVRKVAASAYKAGSRYVDVMWNDDLVTLARFQHAPEDSFEEYSTWLPKAMEAYIQEGAAVLSLAASDPDLLKDIDPKLIQTAMQTRLKHHRPIQEYTTQNKMNWCVVSMPIPAWASKMFPDVPAEERVERLWDAIFEVVRINEPDPVKAWNEHVQKLLERCEFLNQKKYDALHFRGPGTDLMVGLPAGHLWKGGAVRSEAGTRFIPNLPTEEVFTLPHRDRVDGVVTSSRPLSYGGKLVKNFNLTFKEGRVVDVKAAEGQDVLENLLNTDEGARRLGEVALVPHGSPISKSGLLFYNTLFDENAASHFALGRAYAFTITGGQAMSSDELLAAGVNNSMVHTDFMVGSSEMDVDGITQDGSVESVVRRGEWAE